MPALPHWVAQYVGLPYQTHGRGRGGVDCWGLVQMVQQEQLGGHWPPYEGADWYEGQSRASLAADATAYAGAFRLLGPGETEQLGDGILLRLAGHSIHVALVIEPGWMLHTLPETGSCVEYYRDFRWQRRIRGIYRYENQRADGPGH